MHDTVPTQLQDQPSSPVVAQLIALLQALLQPAPQTQDAAQPTRQRGQPARLALEQLWLALLLAVLRGLTCWNDVWRLLAWEGVGSFPLVRVTAAAVRQRLLRAGTAPLEHLVQRVTAALHERGAATSALSLAPFAPQIAALDETTLDALHRWCPDLRGCPAGCAQLLVGKLAGLFELRTQQWLRVQFRDDVLANCKVGVLLLLESLAPGSLILTDLGYFSFPWFDYLTEQGYWWVSRLRERTSYRIAHVFYQHGETLDALVWLGAYRADGPRTWSAWCSSATVATCIATSPTSLIPPCFRCLTSPACMPAGGISNSRSNCSNANSAYTCGGPLPRCWCCNNCWPPLSWRKCCMLSTSRSPLRPRSTPSRSRCPSWSSYSLIRLPPPTHSCPCSSSVVASWDSFAPPAVSRSRHLPSHSNNSTRLPPTC